MSWHEALGLLVPAVVGPRPVGMFSHPEDLCEVLELFLLATNAHHKRPSDFAGVIASLNHQYAMQGKIGQLNQNYFVGRWKKFYLECNLVLIDERFRAQIFSRDGNECAYCGYTKKLHAHHVIPQKLNGPDNPVNLVACCENCNWDIGSTIRIPNNWWALHPESINAPSTRPN